MAKPPESPAAATMFQHAASLWRRSRRPSRRLSRTAHLQRRPAATGGGAAGRRRRRRRRRSASTTRRPRCCRPGAGPRRKPERPGGPTEKTSEADSPFATHGEQPPSRRSSRATKRIREGPGEFRPPSRALVPQTFDLPGRGRRRPHATRALRLLPPRAAPPADEPGPAAVGGRDAGPRPTKINRFCTSDSRIGKGEGNTRVEPAPRTGSERGCGGRAGGWRRKASASGVGSLIIRRVRASCARSGTPTGCRLISDATAARGADDGAATGRESGGLTASSHRDLRLGLLGDAAADSDHRKVHGTNQSIFAVAVTMHDCGDEGKVS